MEIPFVLLETKEQIISILCPSIYLQLAFVKIRKDDRKKRFYFEAGQVHFTQLCP